jgi:hypothetical protein
MIVAATIATYPFCFGSSVCPFDYRAADVFGVLHL